MNITPCMLKTSLAKSSRVESYLYNFFFNSGINLLAWVQSAVKYWWAWEVSHEVNGPATACMQLYQTRQGFYMLSDYSHPTEPHPTQWLFTPHCSVQMSPFPLYVLGNLTEKINIYDKGGMGWRVQVFVLPVFFSKVTVKWILKRGLKQASNPKVWFVVHWPRILSCSVWLHRKSCLKINIHYTVYM